MAYTKLGWSITNTAPYQGNNIFRDSNGYIHVVGFEHVSSGAELYYAISIDDGTTFTDGEGGGSGTYKTLTTVDPDNVYGSPAVLVDSSDNIFVFWAYAYLNFIKKTGGSGGSWGSPTAISGWGVNKLVRAEIDSDDNLIVTGYTGNTLRLHTSVDAGANWILSGSEGIAQDVHGADLCIDSNQDLWQITKIGHSIGGGKVEINKISKTEGVPDTWSLVSEVTLYNGGSATVGDVAIVSEKDTGIIWAFMIWLDSGDFVIQYKKYSGSSWDTGWTEIYRSTTVYRKIQGVSTYNNKIYLYLARYDSPYGIDSLNYDGSVWSSSPETVAVTNSRQVALEQPNLPYDASYLYSLVGAESGAPSGIGAYFISYQFPVEFYGSDTISISDDIFLNLPLEKISLNDTVTLSDGILLNLSLEKTQLGDTIDISDSIVIGQVFKGDDTITLSDDIFLNLSREQILLDDTIILSDSITSNLIYHEINDILNRFSMSYEGDLVDIDNRIRMAHEPTYDITNDFRMLHSWQVPGDAGFQSLGKEYIKVYINGSADDDVDINSVTITKSLNVSHIASFNIGRPYDTINKPTIEHEVEIRYYGENWTNYCLLYKGYITEIVPGDSPESIRINCQDKYWLRNREQKYFFVGHNPQDDRELYYNTISAGLSACGASFGIGEFIPQTMNLFGRGESETITSLVENSGNYAWFYDVDGSKKLWTAGQGSIINLERQELDKNIGLYQVLKHFFSESVTNIINKLRVTMGDRVIRRFNDYGGNKEYSGARYFSWVGHPTPKWDSTYERVATVDYEPPTEDVPAGVGTSGVFRHNKEENGNYQDVYVKYKLPGLNFAWESWSDRFKPQIKIESPFPSGWKSPIPFGRVITEGFTIDYLAGEIVFNQRVYLYKEDTEGKITDIKTPIINVFLYKKEYYSETDDPSDNPQNSGDITSPLVFITDKMGTYTETIWDSLQLTGLGIQVGGWRVTGYDDDDNPIEELTPSWNDTAFAQDLADWQLSDTADKKIKGSIDLTIDAVCYYGIDLTKRIMIDNVLEDSLNIQSISYNLSNFTVTIELENERYYKRSVSLQSRGV